MGRILQMFYVVFLLSRVETGPQLACIVGGGGGGGRTNISK